MTDLFELSETAHEVAKSADFEWMFEDLQLRILNGDITTFDDASEYVVEELEGEDDDFNVDEVGEELAAWVWARCYEIASAWEGEETDADRVMSAFDTLEGAGFAAGLFTDMADLDVMQHKGGVVIWVDAWEDLSHEHATDLVINAAGGSVSDAEVISALVAALQDAGLSDVSVGDAYVELPVVWRWHVEDPDTL